MGGEWEVVELHQICDDITVGHVGLMAGEYVDHGIPFLRSLNVRPFDFVMDDVRFISSEFHSKLKKSALNPGDVVIVRTGRPGACAVIPDWLREANCSDLVILRAGRRVRPEFISYVVNTTAGHHISAHTVGAVQQHFNVGSARTIQVNLPSLGEQDRILELLLALDGRVGVNRLMAETLEAMARALFKSWFVDFDPVHARAEGRPTGLHDDLAALFPDSFIEGHRGPLPSSWRVAPLCELADVARGLSYKGDGLRTAGLPLLNLNSIYEGGGYKYEGLKYYNGPYWPRHEVQGGDIIVANTEQGHDRRLIGYAAMVPDVGKPAGIFSQHLYRMRMRPSATVSAYWLLELLNARTTHDVVSGYANGSTVNMLPIEAIKDPQFPIPSPAVAAAFDKFVQPSFNRRQQLLHETRTLAALRDTLLPKLISGELRIADAERQIAAA